MLGCSRSTFYYLHMYIIYSDEEIFDRHSVTSVGQRSISVMWLSIVSIMVYMCRLYHAVVVIKVCCDTTCSRHSIATLVANC